MLAVDLCQLLDAAHRAPPAERGSSRSRTEIKNIAGHAEVEQPEPLRFERQVERLRWRAVECLNPAGGEENRHTRKPRAVPR